eukprot:CAMPEP_0173420984 /NCGR_PEP_ID=MMETSP1357-20121228/2251_1 /TAXON_ID=77926 /ORGANISM="Hemiselmis rufescens, Strain PCC563" /LENGTH=150 /DNA_ID=CAMNT_0014383837 /DNA_START=227 /DNA_END=679 /DNA_ORIENTATION=-
MASAAERLMAENPEKNMRTGERYGSARTLNPFDIMFTYNDNSDQIDRGRRQAAAIKAVQAARDLPDSCEEGPVSLDQLLLNLQQGNVRSKNHTAAASSSTGRSTAATSMTAVGPSAPTENQASKAKEVQHRKIESAAVKDGGGGKCCCIQ